MAARKPRLRVSKRAKPTKETTVEEAPDIPCHRNGVD
jgi:hypothetical protein